MIPDLLIMTEFSEKYFFCLLIMLKRKLDKCYFIDNGIYFMHRRNVLRKYQYASYVFCAYGLKKRGIDLDAGILNAGLAYLSQLIEKSQRIVIL